MHCRNIELRKRIKTLSHEALNAFHCTQQVFLVLPKFTSNVFYSHIIICPEKKLYPNLIAKTENSQINAPSAYAWHSFFSLVLVTIRHPRHVVRSKAPYNARKTIDASLQNGQMHRPCYRVSKMYLKITKFSLRHFFTIPPVCQ